MKTLRKPSSEENHESLFRSQHQPNLFEEKHPDYLANFKTGEYIKKPKSIEEISLDIILHRKGCPVCKSGEKGCDQVENLFREWEKAKGQI